MKHRIATIGVIAAGPLPDPAIAKNEIARSRRVARGMALRIEAARFFLGRSPSVTASAACRIVSAYDGGYSIAHQLAAEAEVAELPSGEAAFLRARFGLGKPRGVAHADAASGWSLTEAPQLQARALRRLRWRSLGANAHTEWDEV